MPSPVDTLKALRELRDTGDVSDWRALEAALDAAIAAQSLEREQAEARAEAADVLLREGVGGFGRVLIQTNDNAAVQDWRKRASAHLSGATMQSRVPVGGEG